MTPAEVETLIQGLEDRDDREAYRNLQELEAESRRSDTVAAYWDTFAAMTGDRRSYVRVRGARLIAANACWATAKQISDALPGYLRCLQDERPTVVRQCIQRLPALAKTHPEVAAEILSALDGVDGAAYGDAMGPLIQKDAGAARRAVKKEN